MHRRVSFAWLVWLCCIAGSEPWRCVDAAERTGGSEVSEWPAYSRSAESADALAGSGWQVGQFRVTPYGSFWGDLVYASRRTFPGAYSLWVSSPDVEGEPAVTLDIRRTRLGLDVAGPRLAPWNNAASGGKVEIDFHGDFIAENRASVLLRHAYWEAHTDGFRLLVGQTWDVISPLQPGILDYGAAYLAGNPGFRRAQIRGELYHELAPAARLVWQGSLNQDIVADFPDEPGVDRESAAWPVLQGRLAVESTGQPSQAWQAGISAHIGQTGFDFLAPSPPPLELPPADDVRFLTWSLNVDLRLPLTARCGVQGELFMGSNLSAYLAGIGQGVCPCNRQAIRSRGGWCELWYEPADRVRLHLGAGLDDPIDRDLLFGRTYNHVLYLNGLLDVTPQLTMGLELTLRKTLFQDVRQGLIPDDDLGPRQPGSAVTVDWMFRYSF